MSSLCSAPYAPGERLSLIHIYYLRILGLCQFFSCIEGAATGAFNGLGETKIPSGASIFFNVARVPFAMLLSSPAFSLGLNGVWWALTIASIIKGTLVTCWYSLYVRRKKPVSYTHLDVYKRQDERSRLHSR